MKLLYINVIEQNAGWGAEFFLNRAFLNIGVSTSNIDYRNDRYKLSKRFLKMNTDFDVLFLQRGDGFPLELLQAVNCPRFFWASELVARNRDQDRLLKSGLFEHIFVHSDVCKNTIINNGWITEEKVSVLLNGFDETTHHRMSIDKDIDVLFVGNILPRRRKWLDNLKDINVTEASVYGKEMTTLFNRAKIVLNIHAEDFPDTETRVFEALGCGCFLITERLSKNDNPFITGTHLVEVNNCEQMAERIRFFLGNAEARNSIAECGHSEALSKHTYAKRAESLSNLFSSFILHGSGPSIDLSRIKSYAKKEFFYRQFSRMITTLKHSRVMF